MYLIVLDGITYGRKDGGAFSLVEAMRELYGVGHAWVIRTDGTVVVARAGSAYAFDYVPRGRTIRRRKVWTASRQEMAELQAQAEMVRKAQGFPW